MLLETCNLLAAWAVPAVLLCVPLLALCRGVKVYEVFVEGAGEGFQTAVRILPFLVAMLVAVRVFRDSGAMDAMIAQLLPLLEALGVPEELVPLAVLRPLSGTGALGLATELLQRFGPDSLWGRIASTVMGSTDTTFYILTVYFGAVGVSKARYAPWAGLVGDATGFFASVYLCRYFFG